MRTKRIDKRTCTNQTTSWLMHSWNTFGAWTSHKQTRTHKTPHDPYIKEATTFPLYYFLCLATGLAPKYHFVMGLPSGSPKIPKNGTLATLEVHNFVCKPLIEMRSKAKL
jgi:hypothetical protein